MKSYMIPNELAWTTEVDHDKGLTIVSTEYMTQKGKYKYNSGRGYYRGEKLVGKIPEGGYLTHKKWHLNEVFTYILLLQFRNSDIDLTKFGTRSLCNQSGPIIRVWKYLFKAIKFAVGHGIRNFSGWRLR